MDDLDIRVNGNKPDVITTDLIFPNNHAPLKEAAGYLFFDIGAFAKIDNAVANFQEQPANFTGDGEIKALSVTGLEKLAWAHFDLLAIEVTENGSKVKSTLQNNPGSHDVSWKPEDSVGDGAVPEPGILSLLAAGLLGISATVKRKNVQNLG